MESLEIERSNLVVIIDGLQRRGLITRKRNRDDRRSFAVHPTKAGKALCEQSVAAVLAHERRLFSGLPEGEATALGARLGQAYDLVRGAR